MRFYMRLFATPLSANPVPASRAVQPQISRVNAHTSTSIKRKLPNLSLEHFLLRSRVLSLYRTIVRAIYQIPDASERREPIAHAKGEFLRNKGVTDTAQIRYLASTGKAEWDGMRRYVEGLAARGRALREQQVGNEGKEEYSEEEDESRWERPRTRNVPR